MKNLLLIVSVLFCFLFWVSGCSRPPGGSGPAAAELIVAGQETSWAEGNSLLVSKRHGDVLEGIRLTRTDTVGSKVMITSPKGRIVKSDERDIVTLELDDVATLRGNNQMHAQRMTLVLRR